MCRPAGFHKMQPKRGKVARRGKSAAHQSVKHLRAVDRIEVDPARLAVGRNPIERRKIGRRGGERREPSTFPSPRTATARPHIPESGRTAATYRLACPQWTEIQQVAVGHGVVKQCPRNKRLRRIRLLRRSRRGRSTCNCSGRQIQRQAPAQTNNFDELHAGTDNSSSGLTYRPAVRREPRKRRKRRRRSGEGWRRPIA